MYEALSDLNVTYVSVGHRPSLLSYHTQKLILRGPGAQPTLVHVDSTAVNNEEDLA